MTGHRHRAGTDEPEHFPLPRRTRLILAAVVIPLILATLAGLFLLWPDGSEPPRAADFQRPDRIAGQVVEVHPCSAALSRSFGGGDQGCRSATVEIDDEQVEAPVPLGAGAPEIEAGDRVVLFHAPEAPETAQYQVIDFDRSRAVIGLILVFAVAVVALTRWRGLASLASLGVSLALVIWFVLPNLLSGAPALPVAVVTASAIMIVALYLGHGISAMTSAALVGTLLALTLTGVIGFLFTAVAAFTGFSDESTTYLAAFQGELDYRGLILAALVIGALGVLDDVTVTQAAVVWELSDADPASSRRTVFAGAMRIGREHVTAAVNTLVLAYVSSMLPLMLLLSLTNSSFSDAIFSDGIGQEIARGLIGSLGIIAAVPLTTWVAVLVAGSRTGRYPHTDDDLTPEHLAR